MRCWSKNKHEKDGQPPRAWGKTTIVRRQIKKIMPGITAGVEGGVRRLYFGNDGAIYDAVDCQQRQ
ncbi:hypothetical protein ECZU34_37140 [Escherichia coli]|nr:hypothetical protein ECZU17_31420 [Escherichia coli]GHL75966.1 hypothetical protein ECZU34_37140 [Escherichia coli]